MLIHLICAARPNFMKIAPLYHALVKETWAEPMIVHTGQHYDLNMSDSFFRDLRLPEPHTHLDVGSGTHAEQAGKVMMAYEKILFDQQPAVVVVVGDVNSTMACAIAASKISYHTHGVKKNTNGSVLPPGPLSVRQPLEHRPFVAHLEAGLRSFDRTMPEEVNRVVTDALADILWTPSPDADENLLREGIPAEKILRVGNIMIDSLEMLRDSIERQSTCTELNLIPGRYGVVTLHRPSNVDNPEILRRLCKLLASISHKIPLVFPVHPRTRKNLERFGLLPFLFNCDGLHLLEPLNYISFMNLAFNCRLVITDSGGIQEETSYLGKPCCTLRENTERPITITQGTNQLCRLENLEHKVAGILSRPASGPGKIELWDGKTAGRIVEFLRKVKGGNKNYHS